MSISSAPLATASAASAALTAPACAPEGKPQTVARARPSGTLTGSRLGETHTAQAPSRSAWAMRSATWAPVASGLRRVWSMIAAISARVVMVVLSVRVSG